MYFKFTVEGDLEDIVRSVWPYASGPDLEYDYENVYEWVWLNLPEQDAHLNISREHKKHDDAVAETVFPIFLSAMEPDRKNFVDELDQAIARRISLVHGCEVEVFDGRYPLSENEETPVTTIKP